MMFFLFGLVEFLVIFHGASIFNTKTNFLVILLHLVGVSSLLYFKNHDSHYEWIKFIVFYAGLVPAVVEIASSVYARSNYRRRGGRT